MTPARSPRIPGTLAAAITSGGMIAQQVAGKAVRDALFLSSFHTASLPLVMGGGAIASLLAVLWLSRLMARHSPRRVMPVLFGASSVLLVVEWALVFASPPSAAVAVYLHTAVFSPVIISSFWSLINERFDPHTAKPAVATIASGGTLGGVLGGLLTWRASSLISVPSAVLMLAAINLICLVGTFVMSRHGAPHDEAAPSSRAAEEISPLAVLRDAPFLRNLAILVAVGSALSSLLDYVFSTQATLAYGKGPALLAFFSLFGLAVSVLSFLLQLALGRVAMEKMSLAVNIAVLPGIIILGGAAGIAVPGLVSATLLRGAEMVQRNTLFRSAYELLYTPLSEERKRSTKALIDVGFDRLGTVLGSGAMVLVLARSHHDQLRILMLVVVLALLCLPIARRLHKGYVEALEQGLRDGAKKLGAAAAEPPARNTIEVKADEKARDRLISHVERLRNHDDERGLAQDALANPKTLRDAVDALLSNDVARVRKELESWDAARRPLTSFAILLLSHAELHEPARKALRDHADPATGQLVDALLDPEMDFVVRRRIPAVLAACRTQRAADGLLLGIADERFEVRYACSRALVRITDRNEEVMLRPEKVIQTIRREVARAESETAAFEEDVAEPDPIDPKLDVILRDRANRNMEHLFTMLALLIEREPLRLCFRALHREDVRQRGTALEYLQTVLPSELRDAIFPLISDAGILPTPRDAKEVLSDLMVAPEDDAAPADRAAPQKTPATPRPPPPG